MEQLLNEPYLLRFGSKNEITENAKPLLVKFLNRKNQGKIIDNSEELSGLLNDIRQDNLRADFLKSQIKRISVLEAELVENDLLLELRRDNLKKWINNLDVDLKRLFIEENISVKADNNELALLIKKIEKWKRNRISRFLFDWFYQSKFEATIKNINKSQSEELYEYIQLKTPWAHPSLQLLDSSKANLSFLIELKTSSSKLIKDLQLREKEIRDLEETKIRFEAELTTLLESKESFEAELLQIGSQQPRKGINVLNSTIQQRLFSSDASNVQRYLDYLPANVWMDKEVEDFRICSRKFVSEFSAICITALSIKNSFPLSENIFDLLVIDEASQCDIASALPMIYRAKRVVIIGDPLQLKHITSVQRYEERYTIEGLDLAEIQLGYVDKSLYDFSFSLVNKSALESVFLDEHYRCHPEIINFSNTHFYLRRLGQSMTIRTTAESFQFGKPGMNWVNSNGVMHEGKNINISEVNKCVDLVYALIEQFPDASIGIITPFKDQYIAISEKLLQQVKDKVKPDTVHRYQGDEKDIIILSLVVSENSPASKARYINSKDYLLNVAITRARSSLYIVGDINYCVKLRDNRIRTPLSLLANYVESLGKVS